MTYSIIIRSNNCEPLQYMTYYTVKWLERLVLRLFTISLIDMMLQ